MLNTLHQDLKKNKNNNNKKKTKNNPPTLIYEKLLKIHMMWVQNEAVSPKRWRNILTITKIEITAILMQDSVSEWLICIFLLYNVINFKYIQVQTLKQIL